MRLSEETKRLSFLEIIDKLGDRQCQVLEELQMMDEPVTAKELAFRMFQKRLIPSPERNYVHPRLNELVRLGVVKVEAKRRCKISGKTCAVYVVKDDE